MKIRIYTDGACSNNPGPGGWSVVVNYDDECKQFSGGARNTTNNRMELTAVLESLQHIVNNESIEAESNWDCTNEYELYSDSAYVINTINNKWIVGWQRNNWQTSKHEEVKNVDLWKHFLSLQKRLKELDVSIQYIKIKGHAGHTFNELADKLARTESLKAQAQS